MSASSRQLTPAFGTSARRTPVQRRSRERVQRILLAAEQVVVAGGVDALSTRAVAARARVPIGTLYQYFADRDAIIAALIDRHISAMDARIAGALAQLPRYSVRSIVESTVAAYREGCRDLKDQALAHFPSGQMHANSAWTVIAALAHNLGRWATLIGLPDQPVQTARARRRQLLAIPARLTRSSRQWTLRMPARWPWQTDFTTVLDAIRALPART